MAKLLCPHCGRLSPLKPPKYLCKYCNQHMRKLVAPEPPTELNASPGPPPPPSKEKKLKPDQQKPVSRKENPSLLDTDLDQDKPKTPDYKLEDLFVDEVQPILTDNGKGRDNQPTELEGNNYDQLSNEKASPYEQTPIKENKLELSQKQPASLKENPSSPKLEVNEKDVAWLIVHTENKEPESFKLKLGDNFFGTEAEGYAVDIAIENDVYVSRSHARIQIEKDFLGRYVYCLYDDGQRRSRPSTNGTYLNGDNQRLPKDQVVYLKDGDTIQVGETKLVFKTPDSARNVEEAEQEVKNLDYTATVVLSK